MHPLTLQQFEYRLALALALGALLGLERQLHHKAAGTRTHALVALGAALFVLLAEDMPGDASATGRVAGQIITGIGFLGAGAILHRNATTVSGLTTAATVWCAGAIGTLAGLGAWYQAVLGTGFILAANVLLKPLDGRIDRLLGRANGAAAPPAAPAPPAARYELRVELEAAALPAVLQVLHTWQPLSLAVEPEPPAGHARVTASLAPLPAGPAAVLAALHAQAGVRRLEGRLVAEAPE